MGWVIFFVFSIFIYIIIKAYKRWNQTWYAGLIGMLVIYLIDSTLIKLGAFSYLYPNSLIGELPIFYWLSSFFEGIILVYFYPKVKILRFPYIIFTSILFLVLELIMYFNGYFIYYNWSPLNSFFLNIFGMIAIIWIWNWFKELKVKG